MRGLRTIRRGVGFGPLSTISRGILGDDIDPVDPGAGGGILLIRLRLSLRLWL